MKIFYFGSVIDNTSFNENVEKSKIKPSASAQSFETALINGLSKQKDVSLTVVSAESIASYPNSKRLILKNRIVDINPYVRTSVAGAINLPIIKQNQHRFGVKKRLEKWLKENSNDNDKIILCYGLYPSVCRCIIRLSKKYKCPNCAVVTDVPKMTLKYNLVGSPFRKMSIKASVRSASKVQNKFDSYVFLTETMSKVIAPDKPYIVAETISDSCLFDGTEDIKKEMPPVILYAGTLNKGYGIDMILDSFLSFKRECQLWICGSGDYEDKVKEATYSDKRIKYFGRISRQDVLIKEKQASLLINLRNPSDEYTNYSFPSKMVEYMLSGTPVLTTKLNGIPAEYYPFLLTADYSVNSVIASLEMIFNGFDLTTFGEKARSFILNNKNSFRVAGSIVDFLKTQLNE